MLLAAFTHYAHAVEGIPLTKAELAREELRRYVGLRHEGELGNTRSGRSRGRRKQRKNKQGTDTILLAPDAKTLDRYLGQAMGFMSFRFYEASALFELLPAWLRFLTVYNLLADEEMQKVLQKLSYLKGPLIKIMHSQLTDAAVGENLADWPYETRNNG